MYTPQSTSSRRLALVAGALVLLLGSLWGSQEAKAQWRQRFQVRTPLEIIRQDSLGRFASEERTVAGALLDSVAAVARREDLQLQRGPDDDRPPRSYEEINEEVRSDPENIANSPISVLGNLVFITYDFRLDGGRLNRKITDLQFVSADRTPDGQGYEANETKLLHVNVKKTPSIDKLIEQGGTTDPENLTQIIPFRQRLMFQRLFEKTPESRLVWRGSDNNRYGNDQDELAEQQRLELYRIVQQIEYQ